MKGRTAALVMALFLLLYVVLVAQRAYLFVMTGEPVAVVLGVALVTAVALFVPGGLRDVFAYLVDRGTAIVDRLRSRSDAGA